MHRNLAAAVFFAALTFPLAAHADSAACDQAHDDVGDLRRAGRLLEALAKTQVCGAVECNTTVRVRCERFRAEIEQAIPVVVLMAEEDGAPVNVDAVTIDGRAFPATSGQAYRIDPGPHRFVFQRAGHAPVTRDVTLTQGAGTPEVVKAIFTRLPEPGPTPAPPAAAVPATIASPKAEAPPPTDPAVTTQDGADGGSGAIPYRPLGIGAAALGVVGLGVGTYFGLQASSLQSDANCPDNLCGLGSDADKLRDAKSAGNVATVGFITGALLLAGGVALYLLAPSTTRAAWLRHPRIGFSL